MNSKIIAEKVPTYNRTRDWTFVAYPESLPEDWRDRLSELRCPMVISPLHNKDVDEHGALKKEHYHILLCFGSVKSYQQVEEITEALRQPHPQPAVNKVGMVRYFIHADNPEKAPYDREDIEVIGNIDISDCFKMKKNDARALFKEIINFCRDNNITEFCDLLDYAMDNNDEWFDYISEKRTIVLSSYLKSRHFKLKEEQQKKHDEQSLASEVLNN